MGVRFEWDTIKAASNFRKHKVGLDEATTVFDDPLARIFYDDYHSTEELREIITYLSIVSYRIADFLN
jgi:uncharacterized DUF497 family protein